MRPLFNITYLTLSPSLKPYGVVYWHDSHLLYITIKNTKYLLVYDDSKPIVTTSSYFDINANPYAYGLYDNFISPYGVAIYENTGVVYVADNGGNQLVRISANNGPVSTIIDSKQNKQFVGVTVDMTTGTTTTTTTTAATTTTTSSSSFSSSLPLPQLPLPQLPLPLHRYSILYLLCWYWSTINITSF